VSNHVNSEKRLIVAAVVSAGLALTGAPAATAVPAQPDGPALARQLVNKVGVDAVNRHLIALQRIADTNGGTRAAATEGHRKSAEYIAGKLTAAGYQVTSQEFPFIYTETLGTEHHRGRRGRADHRDVVQPVDADRGHHRAAGRHPRRRHARL
jgi:hypothetical protein